jgi:myosin heavy subunit
LILGLLIGGAIGTFVDRIRIQQLESDVEKQKEINQNRRESLARAQADAASLVETEKGLKAQVANYRALHDTDVEKITDQQSEIDRLKSAAVARSQKLQEAEAELKSSKTANAELQQRVEQSTSASSPKKMQEAEGEIKSLRAANAQLQRQIDQSRRLPSTPAATPKSSATYVAPEQPIQSIVISEGAARVLVQVYRLGQAGRYQLANLMNTNEGYIQYHLDLLKQVGLVSYDETNAYSLVSTTQKGRAYVVAKGLDSGQK